MVNSNTTEKGKSGHRQRLRDRFLRGDAESHSDDMLLELLLTFAIGRKDVKPLAHDLIRTFGSLSQVLSATQEELCRVKGIGQSSIALLKAIDFIRGQDMSTKARPPHSEAAEKRNQYELFKMLPNEQAPDQSSSNSTNMKADKQSEMKTESGPLVDQSATDALPSSSERSSTKQPATPKSTPRKFQVSNGYLLEFSQLARVLHYLLEHKDRKKIPRKSLQEETGLADRQVAGLVSMGAAMGLIRPGVQILTPIGLLVAQHDMFVEKKGSLEWCHYAGAGTSRNMIWFDVFNHLLVEETPMTHNEWNENLRNRFSTQYTVGTLRKHVPKEVRFVIDAYLKQNFRKLELLHQSPDNRLYLARYTHFSPLVLSAMIYDFCITKEAHLFEVGEMAASPGSPSVVFGLDVPSFRQQIEGLHDRGWLRYETTHNLDQIRLKPGFSVIEFLTAHFEDREPREETKPSTGGIFQ